MYTYEEQVVINRTINERNIVTRQQADTHQCLQTI